MRMLFPRARRFLALFRRDEDGAIIVFTLFILLLMLIVSGMAVDFMRFESRRAALQGCIDNAVLAAADLDQSGTTTEVRDLAKDWFNKAECEGTLTGEPKVTPGTKYREVSASGQLVLDTFFLRLIGMDTLTAHAASTAVEGVGDVEVSLVVDISGSMRDLADDDSGVPIEFPKAGGGTEQLQKIELLRRAATAFTEALLKPEYKDKISISLVPYSEHVNIGPDLFAAINTTQTHSYSHCVEFPDAEYDTVEFDDTLTYQQVQHFQWNSGYVETYPGSGNWIPDVENTVCPRHSYERIIPLSQDKAALQLAISQFQPRSGTSIFLGLKWGASLLDPSIKPTLANLPGPMIDTPFDNRPAPYLPAAGSASTIKYIVLMTDGQNDWSNRLYDDMVDTPSEIFVWNRHNWYSYDNRLCSSGGACYNYGSWPYDVGSSAYVYRKFDAAIGDTFMDQMCLRAKNAGIIIFGIAMDSTTNGETQMSKCASSPSHYYETQGSELVSIFEAIAAQITDLRLTL